MKKRKRDAKRNGQVRIAVLMLGAIQVNLSNA